MRYLLADTLAREVVPQNVEIARLLHLVEAHLVDTDQEILLDESGFRAGMATMHLHDADRALAGETESLRQDLRNGAHADAYPGLPRA